MHGTIFYNFELSFKIFELQQVNQVKMEVKNQNLPFVTFF